MKRILKNIFVILIVIFILFLNSNIVNAYDLEIHSELTTEPYSVTLKEGVKKSKYNSLIGNILGSNLENRYKIEGLTTKDQKKTNMCWAYSLSSMIEGTGNRKIYSPAYFDYRATKMYNRQQGSGATIIMALATATSGRAPVLESKFKTEDVYNDTLYTATTNYLKPITDMTNEDLNKKIDARIKDARIFPEIKKRVNQNNETLYFNNNNNSYDTTKVEAIRTLIKEHIKNHGPVEASIFMDSFVKDTEGNIVRSLKDYYNPTTQAYYCNNSSDVDNHAITIVGWDDTYAVTNFNENVRPSKPGAYIVLNSYGNMFNNDAYIYISYEDVNIENSVLGIESLEEFENENNTSYENLYQHDELGANRDVSYGENCASVLAADVYSRDSSKEEYLTEVGVSLLSTQGIQVYVNPNSDDKSQLRQVAEEIENITPGYHIIKLSRPIKLTGEKFVVGLKYTNNEEGANMPIEANLRDSNISASSEVQDIYSTATANEGESFMSVDNGKTWNDLAKNVILDGKRLENTSTCIKAYTTSSAGESQWVFTTGISLNKENVTLKIGKTEKLVATINPTNASNKNVIWTSSNPQVATISDDGTITAVSEGTATITAKSQEGNYTATAIVKVEKNEDTTNPGNGNQQEPVSNIPVTGISLNYNKIEIAKGTTSKLSAIITPTNATNKDVEWSSSNSNVARVSNDGTITAIDKGTANISVKTKDGNITDTCVVTVTSEDEEVYTPREEQNDAQTQDPKVESSNKQDEEAEDFNIDEITVVEQKNANISEKSSQPSKLPYTGNKYFILATIVLLSFSTIIIFIKIRNLKGIK